MILFKTIREKLQATYDQTTALVRLLVNLKNDINPVKENLDRILNLLIEKQKQTIVPPMLTVARHTMGSIDVANIDDPDGMNDEAYSEYTARAMQLLPFFKKEAEYIMKLQHDYWFKNAESWEQSIFGRGTTNGIQLLLDRFELLKLKHLERIKQNEEPSLGSREQILASLQVDGSEISTDKKDKKE